MLACCDGPSSSDARSYEPEQTFWEVEGTPYANAQILCNCRIGILFSELQCPGLAGDVSPAVREIDEIERRAHHQEQIHWYFHCLEKEDDTFLDGQVHESCDYRTRRHDCEPSLIAAFESLFLHQEATSVS